MFTQMFFVLRHPRDPLSLVSGVRKAVAEVDPNRPLGAVMTADARLERGRLRARYFVFLTGVLAATAAMLAAIGVYGTLAYAVSQRTREIGIRKALGARPRELVALVGRRALPVVLAGLIGGWLGALALTRLIASQLWGITPTDPATFLSVSLLLLAVAAVACLGPTRQAIAVDPTITLRRE